MRLPLGLIFVLTGCFSPPPIVPQADETDTDADEAESSTGGSETGVEGSDSSSDGGLGSDLPPPSPDAPGTIAFHVASGVMLLDAAPGAVPRDLSGELDALDPGGSDEAIGISHDGRWLALITQRFDADCEGWPCLVVATADLEEVEPVIAGAEVLHPYQTPVISSDGDVVVYVGEAGPHTTDLYAVRREGQSWSAPELLTEGSTFEMNEMPSLSPRADRVLFDCVGEDWRGSICEVDVSGGEVRVVVGPAAAPDGFMPGGLHHGAYDVDGSIVFQAEWDGQQIWRYRDGDVERIGAAFDDDLSPCILPDGRVATLWTGSPDNPMAIYEIKVMEPSGDNEAVLYRDERIQDIGLGCGA